MLFYHLTSSLVHPADLSLKSTNPSGLNVRPSSDLSPALRQGIEALKGEEVRWRRQQRWKSMRAVFGRTWRDWLSPFTRSVLSGGGGGVRHVYPV